MGGVEDGTGLVGLLALEPVSLEIRSEELGVALDEGERGLELVGERLHALAPGLLGGHLLLERGLQRHPHALHRGEHVVDLGHVASARGPVEVVGGHGVRRRHERLHLAREHAGGAQGNEDDHEERADDGRDEPEVLGVRPRGVPCVVGPVGHHVPGDCRPRAIGEHHGRHLPVRAGRDVGAGADGRLVCGSA